MAFPTKSIRGSIKDPRTIGRLSAARDAGIALSVTVFLWWLSRVNSSPYITVPFILAAWATVGALYILVGEMRRTDGKGRFYTMDNMVLRKRGPTFGPELYTGKSWKPYGDTFAFDHQAVEVTEEEARQVMLKLFGTEEGYKVR